LLLIEAMGEDLPGRKPNYVLVDVMCNRKRKKEKKIQKGKEQQTLSSRHDFTEIIAV
jgi:hypothetical protein